VELQTHRSHWLRFENLDRHQRSFLPALSSLAAQLALPIAQSVLTHSQLFRTLRLRQA